METIQIVEAVGRLAGPLATLIGGLVEAGMSASEAEELVRRDITSLRAEYMRQRAEDEAALDRKHAGERETQPPEGE